MGIAMNPLLDEPAGPLSLPAFERIRPEQFVPALDHAMALHRAELAAIGSQTEPADLANTAAALDRAGMLLQRVEQVLQNLTASATSPALQAVQRDTAAPLAAHWSAVQQDSAVFKRLDNLRQRLDDGTLPDATPEQHRLVRRLLLDQQRAGAHLAPAARAEFGKLSESLAELTTAFAQNVLHDESRFMLPLADDAATAGLPGFVLAAARQAADERGLTHPVVTLSRSVVLPFLTFSTRRDLREAAWRAWVGRGEHAGERDNRPIASAILAARQRQAALLGHACYADFKLADTMAGSRQRVWALLNEVWPRALATLAGERDMLRQAMAQAGEPQALQAWDWRFWAERVRQQHFAVDEAALKPYFTLPAMVNAAFDCAERLFGLRFLPRTDLAGYHPDVQVYEVRGAEGQAVGLFLHDNHCRATKRSGAWMSTLALQHRNVPGGAGGAAALPLVINNNNFARAMPGEPTLLSPDDVRTLFHEFGHGLHGLLSDVGYARLSGTRVLRDFVELPSQLFEHWGQEREVLQRHARHWRTGEPLPESEITKLEAARRFGQGYETVRYTASAIVDLAAHERPEGVADIAAFEQAVMAARGLPEDTGMNHRLPHFQHLFSGDGYASGYYVYLWAEVLEADAWQAFQEAGSAFDAKVAQRLARTILSRGDSVDPADAFRQFRGRDPELGPMLKERGLVG